MDKRDILLVGLAVGLIYTGGMVHSLQKQQSDLSSDVDHIGDQTELAAIHRSYNPAENASITANAEKELSSSEDDIDTTVSVSVDSGMFDLERVEVTAYDEMKHELWSRDETPGIGGQMIEPNNRADFTFHIPTHVPEDRGKTEVRLIKIEAIDETAYVEEDGVFGYGTEYKGEDIGADNPSQLYLVENKCVDEVEDLEDVCFHRLEPLQSYEAPAPTIEINPPVENPDDKIYLNVTS